MSAIVGIGIDLVNVTRFRQRLESRSFLARVFTEVELAEANKRSDRAPALAIKFAHKEAVMKCLGAGLRQGVWFSQIDVMGEGAGLHVDLVRCARDVANAFGRCYWHHACSTRDDYVFAQAMLISGDPAHVFHLADGNLDTNPRHPNESGGRRDPL